METKELINEVIKTSQKKKERLYIRCSRALKIADKYKINPIKVGKIINEKKIKIECCQLGCF